MGWPAGMHKRRCCNDLRGTCARNDDDGNVQERQTKFAPSGGSRKLHLICVDRNRAPRMTSWKGGDSPNHSELRRVSRIGRENTFPRAAIEVDPGNSQRNLACALSREGKAAAGLAELQQALALEPKLRQTAQGDSDLANVRALPEAAGVLKEAPAQ